MAIPWAQILTLLLPAIWIVCSFSFGDWVACQHDELPQKSESIDVIAQSPYWNYQKAAALTL